MEKELIRELYLGNFRPFHTAQSQTKQICRIKEELEEIMNEIKHTKDKVEIENLLFKLDECINKLVDENGLFYFKAGIKFATDFYTEINDDALYNI